MSSKIDIKYNGQGCVSQNTLVQYLKGELGGVEMNSVERHLSGCPMCADELEGLSLLDDPKEIITISASINSKVDGSVAKGGRIVRLLSPLSAVASVVLLVGISTLIYYTSTLKPEPNIVSESIGEPMPILEEVIPIPPAPPVHAEKKDAEEVQPVKHKVEEESLPITRQERAEVGEASTKVVANSAQEPRSETGAVRTVRPVAKRSTVSSQPRSNAYHQPIAANAYAPKARLKEKSLYSDLEIEADAVLYDVENYQPIIVDAASYLADDEEPELEEGAVFVVVEEMPRFNGGDINNFRDYINKNLRYPEYAAESSIQGRVILSFVVEPTGKVSDVKVLRGVNPYLDKEAVRVIESSPLWEPGRQRGTPVRVSFIIPVIFILR